MKRAILCEVCRHQQCVFNALLHRQVMTCSVRPGVVAEQIICRDFKQRATFPPGCHIRWTPRPAYYPSREGIVGMDGTINWFGGWAWGYEGDAVTLQWLQEHAATGELERVE